jgi:Ser/Thr protein kinase RdoA (MazF antagonist)
MAVVKEDVDLALLADAEISRLAGLWEFPPLEAATKLCNGYGSVNYKVTFTDGSEPLVLKVAVVPNAEASAAVQALIMAHLSASGFALSPVLRPLPDGALTANCVTDVGATAAALVIAFSPGVPANQVAADPAAGERALAALGGALAQLHALPLPATPIAKLAIDGDGFIEDYMQFGPGGLGELRQSAALASHPMTAFLDARAPKMREALARAGASLPRGLIHGDPFLDNLLVDVDSVDATALLDWEDSTMGPFVYDLATSVVGGCFDNMGALREGQLRGLLRGYAAARPISDEEAAAIVELMWANAMCVAGYRFQRFNLALTGLSEAVKNSYVEMKLLAEALEGEALPKVVNDIVAEIRAACMRT